jgi:hypothetical protein
LEHPPLRIPYRFTLLNADSEKGGAALSHPLNTPFWRYRATLFLYIRILQSNIIVAMATKPDIVFLRKQQLKSSSINERRAPYHFQSISEPSFAQLKFSAPKWIGVGQTHEKDNHIGRRAGVS